MSTHSTSAEGPKSCASFRKWLVCWHHGRRSLPCTCRWPQICRLWAFRTSRLKQREVFHRPLTKCSRQSCVLWGIDKLIQLADFSKVCQEKAPIGFHRNALGANDLLSCFLWPEPHSFSSRTALLVHIGKEKNGWMKLGPGTLGPMVGNWFHP